MLFLALIAHWEREQERGYLEADDELTEALAGDGTGDVDDAVDGDGASEVSGSDGNETGSVDSTGDTDGESRDRPWLQLGIVLLAVAGMTVGSELAVVGTRGLLVATGIAGLAFGATIMSFIASIEEVFLTVEPVRDGRPQVATGNVVGSIGFFVMANVGILALIRPLTLTSEVFVVQWPLFLIALAAVVLLLYWGRVGRPAGVFMLALYVVYWAANYLL